MSITKRFIPIQASLERILDTTSENKISIQDGKVLYTIDGGFSFFDLSGIRYLKASVAAVENLETEGNGQRTIKLASFKGGLSVVKSISEGYQIFYTDSSGQVNHVAGGVSPDTKNTAGATNSTGKLFLVGSPTQDFTPQTYTNVNIFAQNGELTANKLIAKEKIELGVESGPTDMPVTTWWEFDPLNSNALNFRNKNNTGRAILQITNSNKIIAYTDNITSAINTLNATIETQLEEIRGYVDTGLATKANTSHTHTISAITDSTTLGRNLVKIPNETGSAITFPQFNSNNTVSKLSAAAFRAAIGAGTSSTTGTVTSIVTNNGITGGPISITGTIGLTGRALALHNLSATSGVVEASTGTNLTTRAIDTTIGGVSGSANLITSGAVFAGLTLKVGLTGNENIAGDKNFIGTLYYGGEEVATLEDLTTVFKYMGSKATYADLPLIDNRTGDVWNVLDTGNNYAWSGTEWDNLAGVVDLSNYYTKAEINTLLNAKENLANKVDSFTTGSATLYPTTNAVKTYVDTGLLLKENISNKKTTLTDSAVDYPSTGAVKTYVDTQITTINNSKVDNAPIDGKVYGQQYGDWTSLEDTAELREALCFEGSWDPTSWTPRDVVDGGTI